MNEHETSHESDAIHTEIAILLDRSGSMYDIREDMEGGLWQLILDQHQAPGRCSVSLYTFDDVFEVSFEARPAGEIRPEDCRCEPRGSTALFDAVVRCLSGIERRLERLDEARRPELVSVVVVTDGYENSSTEHNLANVQRAVQRVTEKFGWNFSFLAADLEGFRQGAAFTHNIEDADAHHFEREESRSATHALSERLLERRSARSRRR